MTEREAGVYDAIVTILQREGFITDREGDMINNSTGKIFYSIDLTSFESVEEFKARRLEFEDDLDDEEGRAEAHRAPDGAVYIMSVPVVFKIQVGKKELDGQFLSARYADGQGYLLTIKFSDGHQDEYELDALQVNTTGGTHDVYCAALEKEIYKPLWGWIPTKLIYVINFVLNKKDMNVWIAGDEENVNQFSIYYGNEFRFFIKKEKGQWLTRIPEAYGDWKIDAALLKKIITALNYYVVE